MAATVQEAKRRLTIEATTRGLDEATSKLERLAAGQDAVAVAGGRTERSTVSAERALNRIQRQYDATWRSMQVYEKAERDLSVAQSQGLISEQRKADLLTMVAARHNQAAAAARGHAAALTTLRAANQNVNTFNTANIAAQFQDIGVTTAMGMSPIQIALQQGTQLSAVFEQIRSSGQGLGASLAAAFASIISPVSLVTIGVIGLTAAAAQYFMGGQDDAKALDEALSQHEANINRLKERWGEAAKGIEAYRQESMAVDRLRQAATANELRMGVAGGIEAILSQVTGMTEYDQRTGEITHRLRQEYAAFADAIDRLRASARGPEDLLAFRRTIADLWALNPNTPQLLDYAQGLTTLSDDAARAALALPSAETGIDAVGNAAARNVKNVDDLGKALAALGGIAAPAMSNAARIEAEFRRGLSSVGENTELGAILLRERNAAFTRDRLQREGAAAPIPTARPNLESSPDPAEEILRSGRDRITQLQLEADLFGKTGAAAAAYRFEQEALIRALQQNLQLSPQQIEALRAQAVAYGHLVEAMSRGRMEADLLFERSQLGRSSIEQQIAMRQRSAGLPIDMNSREARMIRENLEYQQMHDALTGFFTTFRSELMTNGGDFGDAFAKAFFSAFNKVADEMLAEITRNLVTSLIGKPGEGGGLFGDFLGSLFGGKTTGKAASSSLASSLSSVNDNSPAAALLSRSRDTNVLDFLKSRAPGKDISHLTGLDSAFQDRLAAMMQDAPGNVTLFSGFRSVERQQQLWDAALAKYGSADAARKWVAPPGNSMHNRGMAADLGFEGGSFRSMPADVQKWLHANASQYGLKFPMKHEPWHIEMMETRGGNAFTGSMGNLKGAEAALSRFGSTATLATQNLGEFGGGLGQFAQSLASSFGGGGGGGLLGFLGMIGNAFSISPRATMHILRGGVGLFAKGGISDGPAIFGEAGPEAAVPLPDGRRIPVDLRLPNWSAPQAQKVIVESHVVSRFNADGGFDSATERVVQRTAPGIAQQQAVGTVRQYDDQQKRGGAQANDHFFNRLKRQA